MHFRRTLHPPGAERSWAAWLIAAGLTTLLFLSVGLPTATVRPARTWWSSAQLREPVRPEHLTFQTLPPPSPSAHAAPVEPPRSSAPAETTRPIPTAPPLTTHQARTRAVPPSRARYAPDSARAPSVQARPAAPNTLPRPTSPLAPPVASTPASPSTGIGAASTCAVCVAGVRAGVAAPQHVLTQAERDSMLQAMDASIPAEAGDVGGSHATGGMGGISIPIGLPGGGPSRAQRKRDSTIDAHVQVILGRLKVRADSALAARLRDSLEALAKRRSADSS